MKTSLKMASLLLGLSLGLTVACGDDAEQEKNDEQTESVPNGNGRTTTGDGVPDVQAINLAKFGADESAKLMLDDGDTDECDTGKDLGLMGLPIGSACFTTNLLDGIFYGDKRGDRDGNKVVDCNDYAPNTDDQGFILGLLCEPGLKNLERIKSLRFDEGEETLAIDFTDFDSVDEVKALGHWTPNNTATGQYPANIRAWSTEGKADGELRGVLAMNLAQKTKGQLYYDLGSLGTNEIEVFTGEMDFVTAADTKNCASEPSKENCHYQEMKVLMPATADENTDEVIPYGIHIRLFADSKADPKFVVIEGKMNFSEAQVARRIVLNAESGENDAFDGTREIYFRSIQKGQQIWGAFDFKDKDGNTIKASNGAMNVGEVIRDGLAGQAYSGVCQDLGNSQWATCKDINYSDYDSMWIGDNAFDAVTSDYKIDVSFENVPTTPGVVTEAQ